MQIDIRIPNLFLGPTSRQAFDAVRSWQDRKVSWDWERIAKKPKGADLDLAIWLEGELCGLAFGKATPDYVELGWLEASPANHPLRGRVMDIALALLRTQRIAFDLAESRIKNPFPAVVELYQKRGWPHLVQAGETRYLSDRKPT